LFQQQQDPQPQEDHQEVPLQYQLYEVSNQ